MQDSLVEYGARRVIITITAILCALLEIVDSTIVNVALNEMKGNLGATLSEIGWSDYGVCHRECYHCSDDELAFTAVWA